MTSFRLFLISILIVLGMISNPTITWASGAGDQDRIGASGGAQPETRIGGSEVVFGFFTEVQGLVGEEHHLGRSAVGYDLASRSTLAARGGTGAFLEGAQGGAGLGRLTGRSIQVSERGLAIVESHLTQFGSFPENAAMVARLSCAEERPAMLVVTPPAHAARRARRRLAGTRAPPGLRGGLSSSYG
ncbi:MAG: hypothetical protein IT376_20770 [Polyangiaceae bacterium]|nr:hypothetical protein [Polyangiaceae bacterium]